MPEKDGLSRRPVYMDHHATTPVDARVLDAMLPYFGDVFGNAASVDHLYGARAARAVDNARGQIARVINARPEEIVFTSGATESDNLAILGVAERHAEEGNQIITCATEHKAVLDTCRHLERRGWKVTRLPVDRNGLLDPDDVESAITDKTVLISVMMANNEIGTIAPIAEIGRVAREYGVLFHTDAAQAVGHIPVDVEAMNVDLLSMSGHKVYGPKGVGALYVRKSQPRVRVAPQMLGGGHERGMRSGTLNVPGIVGLGESLEIARKDLKSESGRLQHLRDGLWNMLRTELDNVTLNGHPVDRLPHNLNVVIQGVEGRSLLVQLKDDVALSTGSACTTSEVEPSHVIMALGHNEQRAHQSVRFGLGRENTETDIKYVATCVVDAVRRSRRIGSV